MLEPCEPLERTLQSIDELASGDYLHVLHRREPHLLYPLLEKAGFDWRCIEKPDNQYAIYIWRAGDSKAADEAAANLDKLS